MSYRNTKWYYIWYRGLNFFNFGDITKILWYRWFFSFSETFRNECSERNERRGAESAAKAGVPLGVAEAEDEATRSEWSERNEWRKRLCKMEKHQRYYKGFSWYHQIKKVNVRDIRWYAFLAHFAMIEHPLHTIFH